MVSFLDSFSCVPTDISILKPTIKSSYLICIYLYYNTIYSCNVGNYCVYHFTLIPNIINYYICR